jgi:hypothetical protein
MLVRQLFKELSLGELSNLSLSAEGTGVIVKEKQEKILLYAQDALTKLYGRFLLSEKSIVVQTRADVTVYPLELRYAVSQNTPDLTAHIIDTEADPFLGDLIKVLSVVDSEGNYVALNDGEALLSVFTPSPSLLRVPEPGPAYILSYQANHAELVDDASEIILPGVLEPALKSFIAGKVYGHMNGQDNAVLAQNHMAEFEGVCLDVTDRDLVNSSTAQTSSRFQRNGWV